MPGTRGDLGDRPLDVITIAFGLVFVNILREWVSFTGGASGLASLPRPTVLGERLLPTRAANFNYYYLIAACLCAALWVQWALVRSRFGRAMRASAQRRLTAVGRVAPNRLSAFSSDASSGCSRTAPWTTRWAARCTPSCSS